MILTWVLGSRGLLGSAICRRLSRDDNNLFFSAEKFCWDDMQRLPSQIEESVRAFSLQAAKTGQWEIYWAAGVGTMSCSEEALAPETLALSVLLQHLQLNVQLMDMPGAVIFSSSAGAIYAGALDDLITENTPPAPTTPYAHAKLKQEELLSCFAAENEQMSVLLARLSTLYGCGQASGKSQGLLTHIARSILRAKPIQIYVPFDTIRDYIAADDAAAAIVDTVRMPQRRFRMLTKIIASEQPTTIAEIVSIFKRLSPRPPRIITSANQLSSLYTKRLRFRSIVLSEKPQPRSLFVGISQLMNAERAIFTKSQYCGEHNGTTPTSIDKQSRV
ncbi:hypothetical protein CKO12_11115 [Chromatium okenii]|uniref:NAD-dependent epimerase/dehydratase family protein n=1 Tax=Chromatium okenii TaxID=61644 RepID=UPI0019038F5C|nr:NAD-dependent epimerase/dehydratase family protein [Chromatium okenii]MBK1642416.1 hypothetical protein [Chromatium okenii]